MIPVKTALAILIGALLLLRLAWDEIVIYRAQKYDYDDEED